MDQPLLVDVADGVARLTINYPERLRKTSHDAVEGPRAFTEKRAPQWRGR